MNRAGEPLDGVAAGRVEVVGDLMNRELVSLPSWFPADKAAAVLRQSGKAFALVTDRTGPSGVADIASLTAAPLTKSVMWCAASLGPAVEPSITSDEALELMDIHAVCCLPIVVGSKGGVIVGIVTREAIVGNQWGGTRAPAALAA